MWTNATQSLIKTELKRKTKKEYLSMRKGTLVGTIMAYIANYDRLRKLYVDKTLEAEFLNRRIKQLENRIHVLSANGKYHSFRDIDKSMKNIKKKKE